MFREQDRSKKGIFARELRVTNQADSKLAGRDSFSDLGAATVHEAASGIRALPSSIKPLSGEFRLFGAAFTVKFPPADNLWLHRAIYAAPTGAGSGYPRASDGLEAQTRGMFADVGRVVEARGGKVEHIVKMTIWVCHRAARRSSIPIGSSCFRMLSRVWHPIPRLPAARSDADPVRVFGV
jgi:hypothetical protein